MTTVERPRDISLDRAKGIAMLLVAYGHAVQSRAVGDHPWYVVSKAFVYHFHMPLFMMISGYLFFRSGGYQIELARYAQLLLRRTNRLLIPFLAFAITVIVGKYLVGPTAATYDTVTSLGSAVSDVVWNTKDNPVFAIWYLLVLFIYCAVTPLIYQLGGRTVYPIAIIALFAYGISVPRTLYADRILHYYIFFVIGGCLSFGSLYYRTSVTKIAITSAVAAIAGIAMYAYIADKFLYFGTVVSFLVLALCYSAWAQRDTVFPFVGQYALVIYLTNTIAIGVGKLLWDASHIDVDAHFISYIVFLTVVGIVGPLVLGVVLDRYAKGTFIVRYIH